jgi:hypothetical protein
MTDQIAPGQWARAFRIVWPDGYDGLHGVLFPSGRVVVDDTTSGLIEAATSLEHLHTLKNRELSSVEWAPEASAETVAVLNAAREEAKLIRLVAAVVPGSMSRGPRAELLAAVDAWEAKL